MNIANEFHVAKEHDRGETFINSMLIQIKILKSRWEQAATMEIVFGILILDPFVKQFLQVISSLHIL